MAKARLQNLDAYCLVHGMGWSMGYNNNKFRVTIYHSDAAMRWLSDTDRYAVFVSSNLDTALRRATFYAVGITP